MSSTKAAYLSTIDDDGYPHIRAISNLRNKDEFPGLADFFHPYRNQFTTFIVTNTSSSKIGQIEANPKCSLYYCNPIEWCGLTLKGRIEIIDDIDLKKALWLDEWERFYPAKYKDPEYTVLRVVPDQARGWDYNKTFEFSLKDER
jgi:general stress protein 26